MENITENININRNTFFLDEVNELSQQDAQLLITMSEDFYHRQISSIVDQIVEKGNIKIILIAGPSSSGKTTTSNLIGARLKQKGINSITVSLDDFFINRVDTPLLPNGKYDFENITALDTNYFNVFINDLFEKNEAKMPFYDFLIGERRKEYIDVKIDEKTVVIIEGIHALNPTLVQKHKERTFKVYICLDSNFGSEQEVIIPAQKVRLMRRLIRDYYNRNRTVAKTLETWQEVLDGENLYIKPYKCEADAVVDSTHMYEVLMYATHLMPILQNANKFEEIQELINMLSFCEKLDSTLLPPDSLLHEFLG